jgi:hypothetical protein
MAKKINITELIARELGNFEDKLREFQRYLKDNNISGIVSVGNDFDLSEENQDKLHKEIIVQIKMQDAIMNWLPLLKKLRETEEQKDIETKGDIKIGGMFKKD